MNLQVIHKWFRSSQHRSGLDILLGQAPDPTDRLRQRLDWLGRLVNWVRTLGPDAQELGLRSARVQSARLKYVLQVLDRNPSLKQKTAASLRSIIQDPRALEMFMNVGIPNQLGFIGELGERLNLLLLPQAPRDHDLVAVFSETFRRGSDPEWIRQLDAPTFRGWLELFHYAEGPVPAGWNTLVEDARHSLYLMSHSARSTGLSRLIRNRVAEPDFRRLPFFDLAERAEAVLRAEAAEDVETRAQAYVEFGDCVDRCFATLDEVHRHFREHGVSISLVYQLERLKAQLRRCRTLARLLTSYQVDPRFIQEFFVLLVQENIRARKLKGLLKDNLALACQKIIDSNAQTGEHYITRDRHEQATIFKSALGGGAITGLTTFVKFLLYHLSTPPFITGLLGFANYAASFVGIQLLGFTLATKQPAMTATALAATIQDAKRPAESEEAIGPLVDEIVHLLRSQLAAVAGNLMAVVPVVALIDWGFSRFGTHLVDPEHAQQTIHSFSLRGMTPFYAAWTGVLLWLSSVFAGWLGNWFAYRRLPEAVQHHPRLNFVFGSRRTERFAHFLRTQAAGFAASISLGFLLSMAPLIAAFFGLSLEVRHVTLSSGALTACAISLGPSVFSGWDFWLAIGGIASMGVLNLGVSFGLALSVAIWAKQTSAPSRVLIGRALFGKLLRKPWLLFFPAAKPAARA